MFDLSLLTVTPLVFGLGCLLDLILGDPGWIPHPVRWIGTVIDRVDNWRSTVSGFDWWLGLGLGLGLPAAVGGSTIGLLCLARYLHPGLYRVVSVYGVWSCLSVRSLHSAGRDVLVPLLEGDLSRARRAVDRVVGRNTDSMSTGEVSRAGVETVAEGFLDGVLSPLFWGVVAGVPGMVVYKSVNTLDSMIGYRNDRYREFGTVSARLDDAMNWVPARISLLIVPVASLLSGVSLTASLRVGLADRKAHPSPNAGHPEAAFAGALGCRLGGRTEYGGYNERKPYLNEQARPAKPNSLRDCLRLYLVSAGLAEIFCLSLLLLL